MSGHWVTLLMVCIMFLECSLLVAADEGSDLLDATEIDVARIADQGIINFTQQCCTFWHISEPFYSNFASYWSDVECSICW